jgi:CxxC motif-containing protein
MERKFICIRCPQGCEITTTLDGSGVITNITGNSCKLGPEYVKQEISDPRRTLTSTVMIENAIHPVCPVWTEKPIPKNKVMELSILLRTIKLKAPVSINQIVLENALGTGINVISSRTINGGR